MPTNIELTGSVFASQTHGGISKYITELARGLLSFDDLTVKINAPIHVNNYLHHAATNLGHRGVFLASRFRGATTCSKLLTTALSAWRTPDILHVTYYDDLLGRRRLPRVCTFYDMIHERFSPNSPLCEQKKACYHSTDRSIAISESTKHDMCELWNADPDRIDVVPLASGLRTFNEQSAGTNDRPYLLWVGNRSSYKNFQRTAQAIAGTRLWNDGCEIVLAGGPLPSEQEKQDWHSVGLDPARVRFMRPSDETLSSLYANALMLIYTSSYEGFGIPPLEAMQCRCPVIAANSSSVPEVVGDAGLLIDPDSTDSIAMAVDRMATDATLREQLVSIGLERAQQFTWKNCAKKTMETYKRTIGH